MKNFLPLLALLFCFSASAADRITATISVTNAPLGNTNSLTINGVTRLFTNAVTASPATLIQQTNSIPWTATNVLDHLTDYRASQFHFLSSSASTNFRITGAVGEALTVTLAGGWGAITYSTQTVSSPTFLVRVPLTVEQTSNRTHIASLLVSGQSDNSTNSFATNSVATSNFITKGASALQRITAPLQISGQLGVSVASMTNVGLYNATNRGYVAALTNGYWTNGVFDSATATNLSTPGAGASSQQLGLGTASGDYSLSIGGTASGYSSTAIGIGAVASGRSSVAFGTIAQATATNSVALGTDANATGVNSIALGNAAGASYDDSIAIGTSAATSETNQIVLGSASYTVDIPGVLAISGTQTNTTWTGTNVLSGRLDLTPRANTSLANGYNSGVVLGTNVYIRFSGPSAAYTNAGFAAAVDGTYHVAQFSNPGLSFTLLDNSGTEAAAANRIYTGSGALLNSTNNPVMAHLIYDGSASRWRVVSFR